MGKVEEALDRLYEVCVDTWGHGREAHDQLNPACMMLAREAHNKSGSGHWNFTQSELEKDHHSFQ